jgi:FkbM family methyltransferase
LGHGLGNVAIVKALYKKLIPLFIKKQWVTVDVDGYKLGMVIGGERGLESLGASLIFGNGYEIETTKIFKELVKPGMNVIDVGAHIGYYTLLSSGLVDNGKVYAFEPEERNYKNLEYNIQLNSKRNVVAYRKAVSDINGISQLYISDDLSGENSLISIDQRPNKAIDVEVVTLDSVLAGEKIGVIKIDVDGGELNVLRGAKIILESNPDIKIVMEYWKDGFSAAGYTPQDYWNAMDEMGFKYIYVIDDKERMVRRILLDDLSDYLKHADGVNLLCSKKIVSLPYKQNIPRSEMKGVHKRIHKRINILCEVIKDGMDILEVGCGTGMNWITGLKHLPVKVKAIDRDIESIQYARCRHVSENVSFELADGETFQSENKYDVIICSHILEHLREPDALLNNMHSLLKDDGTLFVALPNGYGCFEIENYIPRLFYKTYIGKTMINKIMSHRDRDSLNKDSQHIRFFKLNEIKELLNNTGWEVGNIIHEEFLGGVVTDRTILKINRIGDWNISVAQKMPYWMVNGWIFICRKI